MGALGADGTRTNRARFAGISRTGRTGITLIIFLLEYKIITNGAVSNPIEQGVTGILIFERMDSMNDSAFFSTHHTSILISFKAFSTPSQILPILRVLSLLGYRYAETFLILQFNPPDFFRKNGMEEPFLGFLLLSGLQVPCKLDIYAECSGQYPLCY